MGIEPTYPVWKTGVLADVLIPRNGRLKTTPYLLDTTPKFIVCEHHEETAGAADRTRTGTSVTSRDFKSLVSTYSTTAAFAFTNVITFSKDRQAPKEKLSEKPLTINDKYAILIPAESSATQTENIKVWYCGSTQLLYLFLFSERGNNL